MSVCCSIATALKTKQIMEWFPGFSRIAPGIYFHCGIYPSYALLDVLTGRIIHLTLCIGLSSDRCNPRRDRSRPVPTMRDLSLQCNLSQKRNLFQHLFYPSNATYNFLFGNFCTSVLILIPKLLSRGSAMMKDTDYYYSLCRFIY